MAIFLKVIFYCHHTIRVMAFFLRLLLDLKFIVDHTYTAHLSCRPSADCFQTKHPYLWRRLSKQQKFIVDHTYTAHLSCRPSADCFQTKHPYLWRRLSKQHRVSAAPENITRNQQLLFFCSHQEAVMRCHAIVWRLFFSMFFSYYRKSYDG